MEVGAAVSGSPSLENDGSGDRVLSKPLLHVRCRPLTGRMTMQLLGSSLFDLRRQRVLTQADVPAVGLVAIDALRWLHGKGFLHRDIKPEARQDFQGGFVPWGTASAAVRAVQYEVVELWVSRTCKPSFPPPLQPPFATHLLAEPCHVPGVGGRCTA